MNFAEIWENIAVKRLRFDDDSTRAHFLENPPKVGDELILHMTDYHDNRYRLVRVEATRSTKIGKPSKIIITRPDSGGASYWISGKSSFHPKGQTTLIPLVSVMAAVLNHDSDTSLTLDQVRAILSA